MSMNVGSPDGGNEPSMMATINTTPLVDVMLVMLIIFLITIPVITHTVPVQLPKAVNIPTTTKPENITVAVSKAGQMFWNGAEVKNLNDLIDQVKAAAVRKQDQAEPATNPLDHPGALTFARARQLALKGIAVSQPGIL